MHDHVYSELENLREQLARMASGELMRGARELQALTSLPTVTPTLKAAGANVAMIRAALASKDAEALEAAAVAIDEVMMARSKSHGVSPVFASGNDRIVAPGAEIWGVRSQDFAPANSISYIDLNQAAALVNRHKRTLERYQRDNRKKMPPPKVQGIGGRKSEWDYAELRPWLESHFDKTLPPAPPHTFVR